MRDLMVKLITALTIETENVSNNTRQITPEEETEVTEVKTVRRTKK